MPLRAEDATERRPLSVAPVEPAVTVYVRGGRDGAEAALRVLDDGSLTVDVEFEYTITVPPKEAEKLARAVVHARAKRA